MTDRDAAREERLGEATMPSSSGRTSSPSRVWLVIGLLLAGHLAFSLFLNRPGYLTYDSGTYHFMVKTFAETGGFTVHNGYEEMASPELVVAQLRAPQGKLVAQYPETYTFLALPLYLLMGYPGLIFLNALAFVGIVLLVYRLSLRLFGDRTLGFTAMAIYAFATFAWDWSHSSYPHLSSTLLLLIAVYWVAGLLFGDAARGLEADPSTFMPALGAGFVVGVALGLRLDSVFVLPGLALPLLLAKPVRWRALLALCAGTIPGVVFLSLTNHVKFGVYNPFSYGVLGGKGYISDLGRYLPAAAIGLGLAALLLIWRAWAARTAASSAHRPAGPGRPDGIDSERPFLVRHWKALSASLVLALGLGAALFPNLAWQVVNGTYQILVDMRIRPEIREASLGRSADGAMIYIGGVKKSLLQSCPWLVLLYVPLIAALKGHARRWQLLFLLFLPLPILGVFGSLAWHGSVALNMRYLNPILPWVSILGGWLWCQLPSKPGVKACWAIALSSFLVLYVGFSKVESIPYQEVLFLSLPLALAALLLVVELIGRFSTQPRLKAVLPPVLLVAFAFSAALVFARDYPTLAKQRNRAMDITEQIRPHLESPAIVFSDWADVLWGLLDEVDDIVVARPANDSYVTLPPLAEFHTAKGRKAYLLTSRNVLPHILQRVAPFGLGLRIVAPIYEERDRRQDLPSAVLVELVRLEDRRLKDRPLEEDAVAPPPP